MLPTIKVGLLQIAQLNLKLATDVPFRKKFEDIISDNQASPNKRVLQMRALLRSAGFRSPTTVRIINGEDNQNSAVISYFTTDVKLRQSEVLSFTFELIPTPDLPRIEPVLLQIAQLNLKLATDVPFRKKFEDIIGDTQTGTNKRVLQMRALLRSAGFRSPNRVRIFNNLGETPSAVITYFSTDVKLGQGAELSFTFQFNPGP